MVEMVCLLALVVQELTEPGQSVQRCAGGVEVSGRRT
jgi:hypothetical protein